MTGLGLGLGLGVGLGTQAASAGSDADEISQEESGVIVKDDFSDSDLPGWTEDDGDWSAPSGQASVNATSAQMTRTSQSTGETFVQAVVVWPESDPPDNNKVLARWSGVQSSSDRDGYYVQWESDGAFKIGKFVSDVDTVLDSTSTTAPTGGESYEVQLYTKDGQQEAWISQDTTTLSDTDTAHDEKEGSTGLAMEAESAANSEFDDFLSFGSKNITVSGLATGQKAKVRNSGGSVVAQATESGGTATIDVSRFGGATEIVPLAGWADLIVTESDDTLVATYDAEPVYPGDTYNFVVGEDLPDAPADIGVASTEGGLLVAWPSSSGATTYDVRHSTDEAAWTVVEDIAGTSTTLTSLDYTETYFVQVRASNAEGDSAWTDSVSAQPWIDVDAEFATLIHESDVVDPVNLGDLGASYEEDDWVVAATWERTTTSGNPALVAFQINSGTADGKAGGMLRLNGDNVQAWINVGSNSSETATSSGDAYGRSGAKQTVLAQKDGTSLTIYDVDGNSIASTVLSTASMDWTTGTSQRSAIAGQWATTVDPSFTAKLIGRVYEGVYVPGGATTAERTAILRWMRERYHGSARTRVELFADAVEVDANTATGPSVVALTKSPSNPVLEGEDATYHEEFRFPVVERFAADDWHMWVEVKEWDGVSAYDFSGIARFDSEDGVTWTEPNLGLVTYDGDTDNALIFTDGNPENNGVQGLIVDPNATAGREYLFLFALLASSATAARLYGAADDASAPTLHKDPEADIDASAFGGNLEAKAMILRDDGRIAIYSAHNHGNDERSIIWGLPETTDETGDWVGNGEITAWNAPDSDNQFYSVRMQAIAVDLWLAYVARYNSTTELIHVDLYVSRDQGFSWTSVATEWLPRGSGGSWDDAMVFADRLIQVGNEWRIYYSGIDTDHDTSPKNIADIGYATLGYRRLFELEGAGAVTSTAILTEAASTLTVNADGSGGDVTVAVLDASDDSTISGYGGTISTDSFGTDFDLPPYTEVKIKVTLAASAKLYSYWVE